MYESLQGQVIQAQASSIHGVIFYDVVLQTAEGPRRLRFQDTFLSPAPGMGDYLRVELLLGNVNGVERVSK